MNTQKADIVICGAGIAGIATAYFLTKVQGMKNVLLIDRRAPMTLTSDKSGECYRNWWPHPAMVQLVNRSIDLMEGMAQESGNFFHLNYQGYAYVSKRQQTASLEHFSTLPVGDIRVHDGTGVAYQRHHTGELIGADVLHTELIRHHFPHLNHDINSLTHVRRAGWMSAQQLGMYMLNQARENGLQELYATVSNIEVDAQGVKAVIVNGEIGQKRIETRTFVNTAGPFVNQIASMLGVSLPVDNVLHQKVVFRDVHGIVPRDAPFTIYLDEQFLPWSDEERELLQENSDDHWLLEKFPGGLHVRPEGGQDSDWIKVGWAFNRALAEPTESPTLPDSFPDIVVRGASRMIPAMEQYINHIPAPIMYDGGFYTRTQENMPIIGGMGVQGAYTIAALSGFGIMAACASGELISQQISGATAPDLNVAFSLSRYENPDYLSEALAYNSGEL